MSRLLLCRFPVVGGRCLFTRSCGRRPKSANERNRGNGYVGTPSAAAPAAARDYVLHCFLLSKFRSVFMRQRCSALSLAADKPT